MPCQIISLNFSIDGSTKYGGRSITRADFSFSTLNGVSEMTIVSDGSVSTPSGSVSTVTFGSQTMRMKKIGSGIDYLPGGEIATVSSFVDTSVDVLDKKIVILNGLHVGRNNSGTYDSPGAPFIALGREYYGYQPRNHDPMFFSWSKLPDGSINIDSSSVESHPWASEFINKRIDRQISITDAKKE
jgi:hypothetical protein